MVLMRRGTFGLQTVSRAGQDVKTKQSTPLRVDEIQIFQAMMQPLGMLPPLSNSTGTSLPSIVESVEK